jgi:hypothetical protein
MTFTCGKLVGCSFILILRAWATAAIPGLAKLHANSQTPKKKPRGGQLSAFLQTIQPRTSPTASGSRAYQSPVEDFPNLSRAIPQSRAALWVTLQSDRCPVQL